MDILEFLFGKPRKSDEEITSEIIQQYTNDGLIMHMHDSEGNHTVENVQGDDAKTVLNAMAYGNSVEKDDNGKWNIIEPNISLDTKTGDINVKVPQYMMKRDNLDKIIDKDTLDNISSAYKQNKDMKYPNMKTDENGNATGKKIVENAGDEITAEQLVQSINDALKNQIAPDYRKFDNAKKKLTSSLGIKDTDLSDDQVMNIFNNTATGEGVNNDTLQSIPDFDKMMKEGINFFGDNPIIDAIKSQNHYGEGYITRGDLQNNVNNREKFSEGEIYEDRTSLINGLDNYINEQIALIHGDSLRNKLSNNQISTSLVPDKDNLAKAISLRNYLEETTPTISAGRALGDTFAAIGKALANKGAELVSDLDVVASAGFGEDAQKASVERYNTLHEWSENEYEKIRHANPWAGALWNISSVVGEIAQFAGLGAMTSGVGAVAKAGLKAGGKAIAKGLAKAEARQLAKDAAKAEAKTLAKDVSKVTAEDLAKGAANVIKNTSGTVRNKIISDALKIGKKLTGATADIIGDNSVRWAAKAGAEVLSDAIIGAVVIDPVATQHFLAGNASDEEKRELMVQVAWAGGGFGAAKSLGKVSRAVKSTATYQRANMNMAGKFAGLGAKLTTWKNGLKVVQKRYESLSKKAENVKEPDAKAAKKVRTIEQNREITKAKQHFADTVKKSDLGTDEGMMAAYQAKNQLMKLQNHTDRIQRGVMGTIAAHYMNKREQKFLTDLDGQLMKMGKDIRKFERKNGLGGGKRMSGIGGTGQFSEAGKTISHRTFSQGTIDYIGATTKKPILERALKNAVRRGDKARAKSIKEELEFVNKVIRNSNEKTLRGELAKEGKKAAEIEKEIAKLKASGELLPDELRTMADNYVSTLRQWYHEFENINMSLGLRSAEDIQRMRQNGLTNDDIKELRKDLKNQGLNKKEIDAEINRIKNEGMFGEDGKLYARTQRESEWAKQLERREKGEYERPKVASEKSYQWGATGHFIDPELVRYSRMVEFARVYDRNNYARVLLNNETTSKVTSTAEQTKSAKTFNKIKDDADKAVEKARKEAAENLIKNNVIEKTLGIKNQEDIIKGAQKQFDEVKARLEAGLKGDMPADIATRTRFINGMDDEIISQAFRDVYGVDGIKDLLKDAASFEQNVLRGGFSNQLTGDFAKRMEEVRARESNVAPSKVKMSDGKNLDFNDIYNFDKWSGYKGTGKFSTEMLKDLWVSLNDAEKREFANYASGFTSKAFTDNKIAANKLMDWFKQNQQAIVKRWYKELEPWMKDMYSRVRLMPKSTNKFGVYNPNVGANVFTGEWKARISRGKIQTPGQITLYASGFTSPMDIMSTYVHELSHAVFSRAQVHAPLIKDALKKLGYDVEVSERVATSRDANELVSYMTESQFLQDYGNATTAEILNNSVVSARLKGVLKLIGVENDDKTLKEKLLEMFRGVIKFVEEKIAGIDSVKTFDEWYSGILSGQFKKEMEEPLDVFYNRTNREFQRPLGYRYSNYEHVRVEPSEMTSVVPQETKQLIENKIKGYLETANPDALKSGENILTYDNFKRVFTDDDSLRELDRSMASADSKLYNNQNIKDGVSQQLLDERTAKLKMEMANATEELKAAFEKAGVGGAENADEAMQMLNQEVNDAIDAAIDDAVNSLLERGTAGRNWFESMCDVAGVADKRLALNYLALHRIQSGQKEIVSTLKTQFRKELKKTSNDERYNDILEAEFGKKLEDEIKAKYEKMRVALGHDSPLVDTDKWFKDVYKQMKKITEDVDEQVTHVTILDDNGHAVVYETDPLVAHLANYRDASIKMGKIQKAMYVWSKVFRLGTTGIRLTSIVNQTFRDTINAWLGGGLFSTMRTCAKDMEAIFGKNPMKYLAQYKDFEQEAIKMASKETGESLAKSMTAFELSKGKARSPAATETQAYRDNKDRIVKKLSDKIINSIDNISEDIQILNNVREKYLRNVVYANGMRDAVKQGHTIEYARTAAEFLQSNATTNFSRSLNHLAAFQQTVPYLGAAVNGTKSFYRLWQMDPVGVTGRLIGGVAIPTMALTAMSLSSEENRKVWKDLPEYMKRDALPFVIDGKVFTIPLPQEISAVVAPFRQFMESLYGADRHAFWELALNDVVGISPIDFTGFVDLDNNDLLSNHNIDLGVSRLVSQLMPPLVKSGYMWVTGIDPYTGRHIYKNHVYADSDTNQPIILDSKSSDFAKLVSSILGGEDGILPANKADLVLSGLFGKANMDIFETLTQLGEHVLTNGEKGSLNYGTDKALTDIASAVTYTQNKPSADYAWNNTISQLYQIKSDIMNPQTSDGQYYQSMLSNIRNEEDVDKKNILIEQKNKWLNDTFYSKAKTMVDNLMAQYGGESFDKYKFASVLSLLTMSNLDDTNNAYQDKIAQEQWQQARNQATNTMVELGFPTSTDYGIFGYKSLDSKGRVKEYFATPPVIANVKNIVKGRYNLHSANIESILKSAGIKDEINAIAAQRQALFDAPGKKNYNAIDALILQQDAKVMKALEPYVRKYGVESLLTNDILYNVLYQYMEVPTAYERDNRGRTISAKNANKKAAFIKSYVKSAFSNLIKD